MAKLRMNVMQIIGNLGADPEISYTPSQLCIAKIRVAVNMGYFGRDKKWVDKTVWVKCQQMGPDAENVGQLRKGDTVFVSGSYDVRDWQDRDGNKRYDHSLKISMIGKLTDLAKAAQKPRNPAPEQEPYPEADDDIPF